METEIESLRSEALQSIAAAGDESQLEQLRVRYLGKGGGVTALSDRMREVSKEEKPRIGKLVNETRAAVTAALEAKRAGLVAAQEARVFEGVDVTLPGTAFPVGALHPITQLMDRA
ncbi:MAG: phenylalanine--tRNA ligase subunit alpha, partial [Verrucomicrobiota bacterium]